MGPNASPQPGSTGLVIFTRDLRIYDHPALNAAIAHNEKVVTAFVFDEKVLQSEFNAPNRTGFLLESLADLDASLRKLGGNLVIRRGEWVNEVLRLASEVGATSIAISDDVSRYATNRANKLNAKGQGIGVRLDRYPGVTVVPAGLVRPATGDHYQIFTPYYRQWQEAKWRTPLPPPRKLHSSDAVSLSLPRLQDLVNGERSPQVIKGGESEGRKRLTEWAKTTLSHYGDHHDDLAGDRTSHLSPYLHFGCLSPLEVAVSLEDLPGAQPFVRQLCWRDFCHQILSARPETSWSDFRPRGDRWRKDDEAFAAWCEGQTGFPVVDAGMRQLRQEGFMHNRARMVVASFLTKDLYIDWRLGAQFFLKYLVDGDIANNNLNWQWTAGTGADTNPHRIFNPTLQGERFDPKGLYIRRYVPELEGITGNIFDPAPLERAMVGYPLAMVDHRAAIERYRQELKNPRI
jgi:deoxyribodipyrimidine photo-lyase